MNSTSLIRRPFRYSFWNATLIIIAANVLVFALEYLWPFSISLLSMNPVNVLSGAFWQPLTYMFVHDRSNFSHILFNMLALFIFGNQLEREIGSKEFLIYYLLTGILAGLFSFAAYLVTGSYGVFLMGASGAVFAVQLAYATVFPESIIYLWAVLPLRAPILVLGATAIELGSELLGVQGGIAHVTHLAGFGFGWIYFLVRFGVNPARRFFPKRP